MKQRISNTPIEGKRLLSIGEACEYVSRGHHKTREWLDEIGATRKFGGRVLFDKTVIDKALDALSE